MRNLFWIIGVALGLALIILKGIELYYSTDIVPTVIYLGIIAVLFIGLGTWLVRKFISNSTEEPQKKPFRRNERAIKSRNITERELEILDQLALGKSNQEIADNLNISINVVNNDLSALYQKLEVSRRSTAIKKARSLNLTS